MASLFCLAASKHLSDDPNNLLNNSLDTPLSNPWIHCASLETPPLVMEVYRIEHLVDWDKIQRIQGWLLPLWQEFYELMHQSGLFETLGLRADQLWSLDLHWVDNATIQPLNADYRSRDQPTDVLTFTLFADASIEQRKMFAQLPEVQLGEIFISVEWAQDLAKKYIKNDQKDNNIKQYDGCFSNFVHPHGFHVLEAYLLERVVHGWLHLLGVTHETEARYNQVIQWQTHVLSALQHRVFNASTAPHATGISP